MKKPALLLTMAVLTNSLLLAHDSSPVRSPAIIDSTLAKKHEQVASGYKEIHTNELKTLLSTSSSLFIIDARPAEDDDGKRIPGAKSLPFDISEDTIKKTLPNKDTAIVVYCESIDCPISRMMAERLVAMGYTKVSKYPEGIEGWENSGNKVEAGKASKSAAK